MAKQNDNVDRLKLVEGGSLVCGGISLLEGLLIDKYDRLISIGTGLGLIAIGAVLHNVSSKRETKNSIEARISQHTESEEKQKDAWSNMTETERKAVFESPMDFLG